MIHSEKAFRLWLPSQKGLFEEWPQRQSNTGSSFSIIFPSRPLIRNGPVTLRGPPEITLNRVKLFSIACTLVCEIDLTVCPVTVRHIEGRATTAERSHGSGPELLVVTPDNGEFPFYYYGTVSHNAYAGWVLRFR